MVLSRPANTTLPELAHFVKSPRDSKILRFDTVPAYMQFNAYRFLLSSLVTARYVYDGLALLKPNAFHVF